MACFFLNIIKNFEVIDRYHLVEVLNKTEGHCVQFIADFKLSRRKVTNVKEIT